MKLILSVIFMALVTYLIRFLPFTILKKPITNPFFRRFLFYIPYSVLAGMTFPAIFYSTGNETAAIIATIVALLLGFLERSLITIAVVSVVCAFLVILFL